MLSEEVIHIKHEAKIEAAIDGMNSSDGDCICNFIVANYL